MAVNKAVHLAILDDTSPDSLEYTSSTFRLTQEPRTLERNTHELDAMPGTLRSKLTHELLAAVHREGVRPAGPAGPYEGEEV